MSKTSNSKTLYRSSPGTPLPSAAKRVAPAVAVLVGAMAIYLTSHWLLPGQSPSEVADSAADQDPIETRQRVTLTPEKMIAAGVEMVTATEQDLQATRTVPGTLQYDATRHLELRAPVECVVTEVNVRTGQWVEQGEQLAQLTSEQIGLARNQIKKCEADLRIAQLQHEWAERTHANLTELLSFLKQDPTMAQIESQFEGKLLGDHRDHLISAYSQYLLATRVADRTRSLGEQGVVSGRTLEERASQREIAAAGFNAVCEQSEFESRHQREVSAAAVDVAVRALDVSRERLSVMLGPHGQEMSESSGSDFVLTSPFAGRVEELSMVAAARFAEGEPVAVLADTRRLWVAAQIHQRDWNSLKVAAGETLSVTIPASPDRHLSAQVRFVGSTVSPTTLALPLVAELDNSELLYHPGMFVWVAVPVAAPRKALAVPLSAIQHHEGREFVFVEASPRTFQLTEVTRGIETPTYVEITAGLQPGARVVTQGSFQLKSELLLEYEAE
jgi:RND family efflux transporter MFP subunit